MDEGPITSGLINITFDKLLTHIKHIWKYTNFSTEYK